MTCSEHTQLFSLDSRQVRQIVQNAIDSSVYEREFTAHAREAEARERELRVQRGIAARAREIEMRERDAEMRGSARGGAKNRGRSLRRGRLSRLTVKSRMKRLRLLRVTILILPHPRMKFLHPYTKNPR